MEGITSSPMVTRVDWSVRRFLIRIGIQPERVVVRKPIIILVCWVAGLLTGLIVIKLIDYFQLEGLVASLHSADREERNEAIDMLPYLGTEIIPRLANEAKGQPDLSESENWDFQFAPDEGEIRYYDLGLIKTLATMGKPCIPDLLKNLTDNKRFESVALCVLIFIYSDFDDFFYSYENRKKGEFVITPRSDSVDPKLTISIKVKYGPFGWSLHEVSSNEHGSKDLKAPSIIPFLKILMDPESTWESFKEHRKFNSENLISIIKPSESVQKEALIAFNRLTRRKND